MVTIAPHPPRPLEDAIHRPGDANRNTARPARKGTPIVGFDQQMKMIGLHGEMNHSKRFARRLGQRVSHRAKHAGPAQAGQASHRAQREVHGVTPVVGRPRDVRYPGPRARRLATRAVTPSAPGSKGEFLLAVSARLVRAEARTRHASGIGAALTLHLDSAIILIRR
jgi:hypothetical protein